MATKLKPKSSAQAATMLGVVYLNSEDFMAAINDEERHRSLPYTLADLQHQINTFQMEPEQLFEMYKKSLHPRELMTIINHTINEAVKKKELTGAGKK